MAQYSDNPNYHDAYETIRFKSYQGGVPWIENDRELISCAFGYTMEEMDSVYQELDEGLARSVDHIVAKYKKEMDAKLPDREITLCCIGCSFASDYQSFFNVVRKALAPYPGIKAIDAAVTSETSAQTISRIYERALRYAPDITTVLIGSNDMRQNNDIYSRPYVSPEEYRKNLSYIAKILRQSGSLVILNTLSTYDTVRMENAVKEKRWTYFVGIDDVYNTIIREVAEENGCILNDMASKFKEYHGPMNIPNNGLHLTSQAHCFFADKFMEALLGLL